MMMALLFCVFLCPHGADAIQDKSIAFESVVACQDMCDCSGPNQQDDYCVESCDYELRDETSLTVYWNFDHIDWTYALLSFEEPQHPVCHPDIVANINSHSFAVRQLDTIILRV